MKDFIKNFWNKIKYLFSFVWLKDDVLCKNLFNIASAISVILVPILVAIVGAKYQADMKEQELSENRFKIKLEDQLNKNKLSQDYIKIALDILDKTSKSSNEQTNEKKFIREWAVDVIKHYSDVNMSEGARNTLISNSLNLKLSAIALAEGIGMASSFDSKFKNSQDDNKQLIVFSWDGSYSDGYAFELEIKDAGIWKPSGDSQSLAVNTNNSLSKELDKHKEYRWRMQNISKGIESDWVRIIIP